MHALSLSIALAMAASSTMQDRPNFTGDSSLDLKASQLHEDYRALERADVRVEHRAATFTYRRTFFVKASPFEAGYEITIDGHEHRATSPNGSPAMSTAHWEESALVVTQRIADPKAGELRNSVRYELMDNGRTLRATEDFAGGGRSHHNVWIYRRK